MLTFSPSLSCPCDNIATRICNQIQYVICFGRYASSVLSDGCFSDVIQAQEFAELSLLTPIVSRWKENYICMKVSYCRAAHSRYQRKETCIRSKAEKDEDPEVERCFSDYEG